MEYTTPFVFAGHNGQLQEKGYATNGTPLKLSCYLLSFRLVFLSLVPNIGYDVTMLRWLSLVFCRFPFQEEKRILS